MPPADHQLGGALSPILRAARRHWWLVLLCIVLPGLAAALVASERDRTYQATAQILVTPLNDGGSYAGLPILTNSVDPTRTLQTAASVLESSAVSARVAEELGSTIGASDIDDDVDVNPLGDSDIVSVVAERQNADEARSLAEAYARTALAVRSESLREAVQGSVSDLVRRDEDLPPDSGLRSEIARERADLQRILDGQDPNFSLLKEAGSAEVIGASNVVLIGVGLAGGALLGLLGAVALDLVNRRVRDEDELLDVYTLPVLARIPSFRAAGRRRTGPQDVPFEVREALRGLQIQLEGGTAGSKVVMFTSPSPGDGKTTTSLNFAYSVAATGARVILLDLDLRKADIGTRLGVQSSTTKLFRPGVDLRDLLSPVPDVPGLLVLSAQTYGGGLQVLEAMMNRIPALVAEARELADYVIIDTAPLGAVSDALRVAGEVDDVVLVVRLRHTNRTDVERSREVLERLNHTPTGMVVVGQRPGRSSGSYGYGEGSQQTATFEPAGREVRAGADGSFQV